MNRRRADRATSEDDLLLLPRGDQAREHRPVVFGAPTDSRRRSSLAAAGSTFDTSTSVPLLDVAPFLVGRSGGWRMQSRSTANAARSAVPAQPEGRNRIRGLYETVADVFEDDGEIAELLQVPEEHVGEWRMGTASDEDALDRLENLSAAVSKLRGLYADEVIPDWLQGLNAHLGGARPIDVLVRGHLSRVIAAIEAERGGAYT